MYLRQTLRTPKITSLNGENRPPDCFELCNKLNTDYENDLAANAQLCKNVSERMYEGL